VGWRQIRPLSSVGEARAAHDGLASRGHQRTHQALGALMMANRRHSVRHVRKRYTYNVREAAKVTGATPGTVRHWQKNGLRSIEGAYPTIFKGYDIIAYFDRVNSRDAEAQR
jgi:hypothetical protein